MSKHTKSCGRFTKTFLKPILWPFLQIFPCQKSTGRGKMRINEEKIIFSKFPHTIWWITCLLRICQSFKEKYENLQQLELKTSAYSVFVYIHLILYVWSSVIYLHISQRDNKRQQCARSQLKKYVLIFVVVIHSGFALSFTVLWGSVWCVINSMHDHFMD